MRRSAFLGAVLAVLTLSTCALAPQVASPYRKPFLGWKELPPDLQWLKQVRLAAYTQLPTDDDKQRCVEDMDVDLMDWYCSFSANRGDFMRKRGIRVSGPEEFEYQEALQFSKPDTVAIFSDNGIAVKLDGTPAAFPPTLYRGSYYMCHNAPKWHEMVKQGLVRLVPFGHTITQDNIGCPLNKGQGNFCRWCNLKFKRYLRGRLTAEQIRKLGLEDLEGFDARAYIHAKVNADGNEKAVEDPLVREYIRFQYISHAAAWEDNVRVIRAESAQLGLPMRAAYGNQYGAWGTMPFATALSSRADVVWIECGAYQPAWADEKQAWGALVYKIGAASGHFNRPVWTWPIGYCDNQVFLRSKMKLELKKSGSGEPYIGYLKRFPVHLVLCEGLAEGGQVVMRPGDRVGTDVYKMHVDYARFVSQNRALFAERTRYVNVALIYSFPTWMWRSFSSLRVRDDSKDFLPALARILEEAHIPYEANIFGHPDLWEDSDVLASLRKYDVVVLPSVDCLSDRQAEALRSYVKAGGILISCGKLGTRDEDFNVRPTPALAGLGKLIEIPLDALKDFLDKDKREQGYERVRNIVASALAGKLLIETDAPRTVWLNSWVQEHGRRLSVHLVNYNADVDADAMIPARNIQVKLRTPKGFTFDRVLWIPFGQPPQALPHRTEDGRVVFTVPEVKVYGIAVLTSGRELEIAKAIDEARRLRERLSMALEDRDGCPARIRELVTQAEQAVGKADYRMAELRAREALQVGGKLLDQAMAASLGAEQKAREDTIVSAADAVRAFDFGNGPVAAGWTQVKNDVKYDPKLGFGWDDTRGLRASDGARPDALHGDSLSADVERTFSAAVPNGDYVVTLVSGHPSATSLRAATALKAEGEMKLLGQRSYGGVFFNRSFAVKVSDGQLDLTFPAARSVPLAAQVDKPNPFAWNVCGLLVHKAGQGNPPDDLTLNDALAQAGLRNWAVIGPFQDPSCEGMEIRYPPEAKVDLAVSYDDQGGRKLSWQAYTASPGVACVPFRDLLDEEEGVVAFAYTNVFAPRTMNARLFFGSTGIGQVWLNHAPILHDHTLAGLMADEYRKDVELKKGWNELLVKVCSKWGGPWAFSASLLDSGDKPIAGLRTSPTGDQPIALATAHPMPHPSIESESGVLEFNKSNEVSVVAENLAPQPMGGSVELAVEEAAKDCVRIEAASPTSFSGLKTGEKLTAVFKVHLLSVPADAEYATLRASLKASGRCKVATSRLRMAKPTVRLSAYNPAKEPTELALDPMDDVSGWKRNDPKSVKAIVADTSDRKEGAASLRAVCLNNGDGIEEFGRIQKDFPEGTDWTAYNALKLWAKVTDEDPSVKKRPICIVLTNRDGGGYQALARHEVPVGEWTLIADDLSAMRRENVSSLVPHLYETNLAAKTSYIWRLDDLRLSKVSKSRPLEEKPLGAGEVAVRLYVSNPTTAPMDASLSLVLPEGWRCDLPRKARLNVPAKRAWSATCRITTPSNLPGMAYPIKARLVFATGATFDVKLEVQPTKGASLGLVPKPPMLDGKLDDECWKAATPIGHFVLNEGQGLAQAQTRAWLCRDAENLYIAFECLEPAMNQLKANVTSRDGQVWMDDCVEIFVVAAATPSGRLYHFVFNTLDVLRDEGPTGGAWNSRAKSKTVKTADRWTIELAIPFADIGPAPTPGETWLLNLNRSRQEKPGSAREYSCWSCTYGPFARPEKFAEVTFHR